jgi:predicted O-methyltransferase YrrM
MQGPISPAEKYINSLFSVEDELLQKVRERCTSDEKVGMQVSPYEGQWLHWFCKVIGARKVVEVGTLYGYSALWMARALSKDSQFWGLELNIDHAHIAEGFLQQAQLECDWKVMQGEALSSLEQLQSEGPFDLIFIDADKAGYTRYLDWAEENVRKGGLIIGDNSFLFGQIYEDHTSAEEKENERLRVMQEFNQRLSNKSRYTAHLMDTQEGMTVAMKNF